MVKRPIGSLFGRRQTLPPDASAALGQLSRLAQEEPSLVEAAELQSALLGALLSGPAGSIGVDLTPERAAEKLAGGLPLLRGEELRLDAAALRETMLRLALAAEGQGLAPARPIITALRRRGLDPAALACAALNGAVEEVARSADGLALDADLLGTLLRFSLFGPLVALAARLEPLRAGVVWREGYCPTCGSWPLLAEQRGLEQQRHLRCGLCASSWAIDRLRCPFCDNRDHERLGSLHVEGEEHRRVATCEECRGYLKVLNALTPAGPYELPVLDLATLHLDMVALERGYAPG